MNSEETPDSRRNEKPFSRRAINDVRNTDDSPSFHINKYSGMQFMDDSTQNTMARKIETD
jgi:hypothetical protein